MDDLTFGPPLAASLPWSRFLRRRCPAYHAGWRARCDLERGHSDAYPHVAERGFDWPAWREVPADSEIARRS